MQTDGADRVEDPWDELYTSMTSDVDEELEAALLTYKQQRAARWGAERFADELRRRDEAEGFRPMWTSEVLSPPVEASVEAQVVDGDPVPFRPEPPRVGFDPRFVVDPVEVATTQVEDEPEPVALAEPEAEDPVEPAPGPAPESDIEVAPEPNIDVVIEPTIEVAAEPEPEPGPEPEAAPQPELEVDPLLVPQPRFVPDAAWSAGSRAGGKLERLPAALRHPHVPRPPAPDPQPGAAKRRRGWRGKQPQPEPARSQSISSAEWARMSPGARRLYGIEEPPEARRAG